MPVSSGCHYVVLAREDLGMLASILKRLVSNWCPWYVVICLWQPIRLSQMAVKILVTIGGVVPYNFFFTAVQSRYCSEQNILQDLMTVKVVCNMHNIYSENSKTAHCWYNLLIEWYDKIQYNKKIISGFVKLFVSFLLCTLLQQCSCRCRCWQRHMVGASTVRGECLWETGKGMHDVSWSVVFLSTFTKLQKVTICFIMSVCLW
jgi:hypothetical protein